MVMLDDDIAAELDLAMMVRRDNVPGARTPDGILTRFVGTPFERLLSQINDKPDPASMEIGFRLLTLGEDTCQNINRGLELIAQKTRADSELHDFSIGDGSGGITFHCNSSPSELAKQKLGRHCERRKYALRAPCWFGLSLDPDIRLQLGVVLDFEWQQSDEMDAVTAGMPKSIPANSLKGLVRDAGTQKVGRNDRCPCGSGKKFKKCCLSR